MAMIAAASLCTSVGMILVCFGLTLEFVAFAAMGSANLRQKLRFVSPFTIQAYGCLGFYVGAIVACIGRACDQ
jgi:hypothetical protein